MHLSMLHVQVRRLVRDDTVGVSPCADSVGAGFSVAEQQALRTPQEQVRVAGGDLRRAEPVAGYTIWTSPPPQDGAG